MFLEQQAVSGHFRDGLVGAAFPGDQRFCHTNENKTKQRRVQHPGGRGCHPWRGDSSREHRGVDTEAGGSSHQQGYRTFTSFPALRFHPMSGPFVTPLKDISLSILISLGQASRPQASLAPVHRKLAQADRADKYM